MKRGQSALEFLVTYGWAFLVILLMIGGLSYFGVLDPSRFLPDKCQFSSGMGCGEMIIDSLDEYRISTQTAVPISAAEVKLINNFGKSIVVGQDIGVIEVNVVGSSECSGIENAILRRSSSEEFFNYIVGGGGNTPLFYNNNGLGVDLLNVSFFAFQMNANFTWNANEELTLTFYCNWLATPRIGFRSGERPTFDITIPYSEAGSGYIKRATGSFTSNVDS